MTIGRRSTQKKNRSNGIASSISVSSAEVCKDPTDDCGGPFLFPAFAFVQEKIGRSATYDFALKRSFLRKAIVD
ncbi:hypothetical protein Trydic_g4989 [Trypoxylus dichotomus]